MTVIKDSVVWITGASAGIGAEVARQMAEKGASIILSARRVEELVKVRQSLTNPEKHLVMPLDMMDKVSFSNAYAIIKSKFKGIDILFNNAGISQRGTVVESKEEVYEQLMAINFFAPVYLTKLVIPEMYARKSGHIIVTSSVTGKIGTPLRSGYAASKHALHGFFDSLRAESHEKGVKVTLVCPGYIKTDISKNALAASGKPHGKMDSNQEKGMSVEECAFKIIRAIETNKSEVAMGGKEVLGIYLKRFFPKLLEKILLKQIPK